MFIGDGGGILAAMWADTLLTLDGRDAGAAAALSASIIEDDRNRLLLRKCKD